MPASSSSPEQPQDPRSFLSNLWRRFSQLPRNITGHLPAIAVGVVCWELVTGPGVSIMGTLFEKYGFANARWMLAQVDAEAISAHEIQTAIAVVDRVTGYYAVLSQAHASAITQGYQLDAQIAQRQINTVADSQWLKTKLAYLADLGCGAEMLSGSASRDRGACAGARELREDLGQDYVDVLETARSNLGDTFAEGFPTPDELLTPEYERLVAKYGRRLP